MPYIILTSGGQEVDRLKLHDPVLMGRSAECDLPVRDVLMSRRHCRLEPAGRGWRIVDLQSKNGVHLGAQRIQRRVLADGDVLRLGRTRVQYFAGEFQPAPAGQAKKPVRPADPFEALAGTISGMALEQESAESSPHLSSPSPWHEAAEESVFGSAGGAQTALVGIELLVRPARAQRVAPVPMPRPIMRQCGLRRPVYRQIDDVSLQVMPQLLAEPKTPPAVRVARPAGVEWRLALALAAGSAAAVWLFMSGWWRAVVG